ncbi:hypothetical protein NHX12_007850 [Muraenolepis orangiensis]|uniref:Uncharacterized protein n=1 Tax=Muraenolepis orangiensis TaxID=630683 RepID=A0A9Q0ICF6_9TELE|nr:hypothetical protein NHX12_007850 [Muraenolepis orangiensis]
MHGAPFLAFSTVDSARSSSSWSLERVSRFQMITEAASVSDRQPPAPPVKKGSKPRLTFLLALSGLTLGPGSLLLNQTQPKNRLRA